MKTTSTGSPKVKKVTSTQPKKRGRPVGSKKSTGGEHSYLTPGSINASKFSLSVGNAPVKTWERGPETGEQTGSKTKKVKEGWEKEWDKFNTIKLRSNELPDSEATVEQVKSWVKIEDINGKIKVGTKGYTKLDRLDIDLVDGVLQLKGKTPTNYWKYACVAILLGIVTAMILSTPLFVKLAEVCSQ